MCKRAIPEFAGMHVAFDGNANLYSPRPLPSDEFTFSAEMVFTEFVRRPVVLDMMGSRGRRPLNVSLTGRLVATLSLKPLRDFLERRNLEVPSELIAVLDIVFRTQFSIGCAPPTPCLHEIPPGAVTWCSAAPPSPACTATKWGRAWSCGAQRGKALHRVTCAQEGLVSVGASGPLSHVAAGGRVAHAVLRGVARH